jgi:hypothetical protein
VKSAGPNGNAVLSKVVSDASPSTLPRSVPPKGRTRNAEEPTPRYSREAEPSETWIRSLATSNTAESSMGDPLRSGSIMWKRVTPSDPPVTLVTVIVSVTVPDGPPPSATSMTRWAEKPRLLTSFHVSVATAPE